MTSAKAGRLRSLWPLLLALAGAHLPAGAADLPFARPGLPAAAAAARADLLRHGEAELSSGRPAAALDDFERAAMMLHASDAELGLVRAALQDGQYQRALAFCAHAAGAHRDSPEGAAMYAWLLRMGGQAELASRTLEELRARSPQDPVAAAVAVAFERALPVATGPLLRPPHRLAPWPSVLAQQAQPPATARAVSGAVLLGKGAFALAPAEQLAGINGRLWVRNGLGQTTNATLEPNAALAARGLSLLRLGAPLPGADAPAATREPFAGSPGYLVQFAQADADGINWPWLRQGFFGGLAGSEGARRLGFDASDGLPGGLVLDARGALAGMQWAGADGSARWWPETAWRDAATLSLDVAVPGAAEASSGAAARAAPAVIAPAAIYEAGLRIALRVMAAD